MLSNVNQWIISLLMIITAAALLYYLAFLLIQKKKKRSLFKLQHYQQQLVWQQRVGKHCKSPEDFVKKSYLAWSGKRKFMITDIQQECHGIYSFYLTPLDREPLKAYKPGQFISIEVALNSRIYNRCYSLSDKYNPYNYRISIKQVDSPKDQPQMPRGVVSNYLCRQLRQGDIINVRAPDGRFYYHPGDRSPVFIAGGIGITPLLSMLESLLYQNYQQTIYFFLSVRNAKEHPFKQHLQNLRDEHSNLRLIICYSSQQQQIDAEDYFLQRLDIKLLKTVLPEMNFDYYICGPDKMMKQIISDLKSHGVASDQIYYEAFSASPGQTHSASIKQADITFQQSNMTNSWKFEDGLLLDFIEKQKIAIESVCRSGNCGSCKVKLISGEVEYITKPGIELEEQECLCCISRPKTDLVLDL